MHPVGLEPQAGACNRNIHMMWKNRPQGPQFLPGNDESSARHPLVEVGDNSRGAVSIILGHTPTQNIYKVRWFAVSPIVTPNHK